MATKTSKASPRGTKAVAKKKGILSKVNFYSRKTQFIIVVLIIAIAGGGYFTYKSFAATSRVYTATIANGQLLALTSSTQINDAAKNNNKVWKVSPGGALLTARFTKPAGVGQVSGAVIRADQPAVVRIKPYGDTSAGEPLLATTSWSAVTSGKKWNASGSVPNAYISLHNTSNTTVYVSEIYINQDSAPTPALAPAPAPAK